MNKKDLTDAIIEAYQIVEKKEKKQEIKAKKNLITRIKNNTIIKKIFSAMRWIFKELFVGVVVGIAVVIATSYLEERENYNRLKDNLAMVHIGESYEYIKYMFGVPVINEVNGERREAYYKFEEAVLRCVFENDELIAYVITVKDENIYNVKANTYINKSLKLLKFSYTDFSTKVGDVSWSVPANNDDYGYYQEVFYGAGPADYNYFIIGNYKDYREDSLYDELLSWCGSDLSQTPENIDMVKLQKYRESLTPNSYGMIKGGYEDEIDIISYSENVRNYGVVLYGDWN